MAWGLFIACGYAYTIKNRTALLHTFAERLAPEGGLSHFM